MQGVRESRKPGLRGACGDRKHGSEGVEGCISGGLTSTVASAWRHQREACDRIDQSHFPSPP